MSDEPAKFLSGNLFRHVSVMSLTGSVGLMALFFVDFVDMVFISMLGVPELAAAVGYAGAILFFTTSFGIGLAITAGALVARSLGAGHTDEAREKATNTLIYGVIFGAIFAAMVWVNLRHLVDLLGATGETADLAVHYLSIIVPTLPFLLVGMIGGAILRAHGDAKRAMYATIFGGGHQCGSRPDPDLWPWHGADRGRLGQRGGPAGDCRHGAAADSAPLRRLYMAPARGAAA